MKCQRDLRTWALQGCGRMGAREGCRTSQQMHAHAAGLSMSSSGSAQGDVLIQNRGLVWGLGFTGLYLSGAED